MSNERLGIFEELQERARRYGARCERLRRAIYGAGPLTPKGAYSEPNNPFRLRLRLRLKNPEPFHRHRFHHHPDIPSLRIADDAPKGMRRRTQHSEGRLGLTLVQVVQAVVLESGIMPDEMFGPTHAKRVAWPRQVAMWCIDRYCPDYSLPEIGFMFYRDHTTVLHAIRATDQRINNGEAYTLALVGNVRERLSTTALAS
jgi:hypothetical protein